ncbi:hypothetical protein BDZ97DRAFT_1811988, partial [Flammula alnicola]
MTQTQSEWPLRHPRSSALLTRMFLFTAGDSIAPFAIIPPSRGPTLNLTRTLNTASINRLLQFSSTLSKSRPRNRRSASVMMPTRSHHPVLRRSSSSTRPMSATLVEFHSGSSAPSRTRQTLPRRLWDSSRCFQRTLIQLLALWTRIEAFPMRLPLPAAAPM